MAFAIRGRGLPKKDLDARDVCCLHCTNGDDAEYEIEDPPRMRRSGVFALSRRPASAGGAISHLAITEQLDGKTVQWLEKVNDTQYAGPK
ncbi:hypothetical protein OKW40_005725 [Paraburkholderia sp. RAU6.4a]|uniref:hypothetical protein n=1 Tax=Paraburkholderia sp. RAU6.4a TaxID=2991067 RepID=UPI003D1D54F3